MCLGDRGDDCEAEPGTGVRSVSSAEPLESVFREAGWEACALVDDRELEHAVVASRYGG